MTNTFQDMFNLQRDLLEEHFKTMQRFQKGFHLHRNWQPKVSQTPHQVVLEEGKIRLLHYRSPQGTRFSPPLLIVFSLINRSYILDLKPGKSIVEKMLEAGFDVYLIDWGVPGRSDQFLTLDDYINRFMLRVIQFILDHAQVPSISMLGYCMGGTMAAMFTSLYPELVKNLMLMAAPIDFEDKNGLLYLWSDKDHFNVEKLVKAMGNIPPWFLQSAFTLTKPMQNTVDKYVKFYDKMEDTQFVDDFLTLEYWLNDNIPLSGQVYKQFVEDCFHENLLVQNKLYLNQHPVNLNEIRCPVLSIVAEHDHLVPPSSSLAIESVIASKDHQVICFPSGHIGLSVSSKAMKQLWPQVSDWLAERSAALTSATRRM